MLPLGHGSITPRFASASGVLQVCSFASDLNTDGKNHVKDLHPVRPQSRCRPWVVRHRNGVEPACSQFPAQDGWRLLHRGCGGRSRSTRRCCRSGWRCAVRPRRGHGRRPPGRARPAAGGCRRDRCSCSGRRAAGSGGCAAGSGGCAAGSGGCAAGSGGCAAGSGGCAAGSGGCRRGRRSASGGRRCAGRPGADRRTHPRHGWGRRRQGRTDWSGPGW